MAYEFTVHQPNLLILVVQGHIDDAYIEMLCVETRRLLDLSPQHINLLIDGCEVSGMRVTAWERVERIISHPQLGRLAVVLNHEQLQLLQPFLHDLPDLALFNDREAACAFLDPTEPLCTAEPAPAPAAPTTRTVISGGFERELLVEAEDLPLDEAAELEQEEPLIRYYGDRGVEAVYTLDGQLIAVPDGTAPVITVLNAATTTLNSLTLLVRQVVRRLESVANCPK